MTIFEDLPSTNTPINASNLNGNFSELNTYITNLLGRAYIEESGNNANGAYIKYSDGTMICYKTVSGTVDITEVWGSGYTTGANANVPLGYWPVAFISVPVVSLTNRRSGANHWVGAIDNASTTSAGYCTLLRFNAGLSCQYTLHIMGIGRWK